MEEVRAAWAIALKDMRIVFRYTLWVPSMIFNPLYQGIIPAFLFGTSFAVGGRQLGLASSIGTTDLAGFVFMGGVVMAVVSVAFWTMGMSLRNEMDMGTLEPSWLTPTRRETLVIGRAIQGVIITGLVQAALFAIGIGFFGLRLRWDALRALPAIAIMLVALVGVGFLVAAMVLLAREANFLVDTTDFLFGMLSGVAFPITVLPLALRAVAVVLPTTWAVEILRHDAIGARTILDVRLEHLVLVVTAAVFLPLGLWAFRFADRYVRVHGTVGQH